MEPERQTRRSFLQGQSAARELIGQVHRLDEPVSVASRRLLTVSVRRRAMACDFEVQLAASRDDESMHAVFAALDLVEALEAQMTIYRDDSEVSRLNRSANVGATSVEARLFSLIEEAKRLHHNTNGSLDITSGPLSEVWGFSRREGRVPNDDQIA
ncbi:MAG TPA: FAD:protein FMN transferase, partial [Lacipirellulaceae bacterium]|nr:FAD:protein FMN transferase [Lacipirellulaceae bacterium]